MPHQYIERNSRNVQEEQLYCDHLIRFLYSSVREQMPWLFKQLVRSRASHVLSYINFKGFNAKHLKRHFAACGMSDADLLECIESPERLDTLQKIFERKIRYWECRPMPNDPGAVVSPSDALMLIGSFSEQSSLFIKGKFFNYEELLGINKKTWLRSFDQGAFALFRLTPDKYHFNHTPVAGKVIDFYQIPGLYHACNPNAVVSIATPYSKNKRVVTIINTDVEGGTHVGLVAMIEVVALMIGDIVQCYSEQTYDHPVPVGTGMFVKKGQPKSLFRPGSSTVILIFQKGRVRFADDIVANMLFPHAESVFSRQFNQPLLETEVKVRSHVGSCMSGVENN
jgi:phosphatidylserine decarboxylase